MAKGGKIGTIGLLGVFALLLAVLFLPTTVLLLVGLLPTLAILLAGGRARAITVGAMNLAGCVPFLLTLWSGGGADIRHAFAIISDPRTVVIIYCAAGAGYLIDWGMGAIVQTIMIQRAAGRQKDIRRRQAELVARWGPEITGDIALDPQGFSKQPADRA